MQIKQLPIDQLKNYETNARTHTAQQIQQIVESIKSFGFNCPIEIDSTGVILSGHARVAAARMAGMTEVPTICHPHLNGTKRRAYILAANRIAESAGWDLGFLKSEFEFLRQEDFDFSLTGFGDDEIESFLNPEEITAGLSDEEDAGELTETPISKLGDIWILGNHRLFCGDSTNPDNVVAVCKDLNPILMVTDPPYGVNYDPAWREGIGYGCGNRQVGKVKNDDIADWRESYALFTGDVIYIWHSGHMSHIVAQNISDCGFKICSQIIWAKHHLVLSRGDYHPKHETCFYAVREGKRHNWRGKRDQTTVWEIRNNNPIGNPEAEEKTGHGTQKPIECMSRPIQNNTKPSQYVYDPFGGSGTTMIACEKLGRRCLMLELDERYCDMIVNRWQKFTGKKAILESTGEVFGDEKKNRKKEKTRA